MIYLDTSVLVALHTLEPTTAALQDWYATIGADVLATATWTLIEFAGALGVKQRTRQMTPRQAAIAWQSFGEQCSVELRLIDSERGTFLEAAQLVRSNGGGLRAGDALHLAIARKSGVAALASLDAVMNRHARKLGIAPVEFQSSNGNPT